MKTENFIKAVEEIKSRDSLDLSIGEDLSIALMNIISLEEHFLFSFYKTSNKKYLEFLEKIRELRKKLLEKIVKKDDDSEKWCISKHLLASSMRMIEVGTKYLHEKKEKDAEECFNEAFSLYSMFWMMNLKNYENKNLKLGKTSKISEFVKKILNCCKE